MQRNTVELEHKTAVWDMYVYAHAKIQQLKRLRVKLKGETPYKLTHKLKTNELTHYGKLYKAIPKKPPIKEWFDIKLKIDENTNNLDLDQVINVFVESSQLLRKYLKDHLAVNEKLLNQAGCLDPAINVNIPEELLFEIVKNLTPEDFEETFGKTSKQFREDTPIHRAYWRYKINQYFTRLFDWMRPLDPRLADLIKNAQVIKEKNVTVDELKATFKNLYKHISRNKKNGAFKLILEEKFEVLTEDISENNRQNIFNYQPYSVAGYVLEDNHIANGIYHKFQADQGRINHTHQLEMALYCNQGKGEFDRILTQMKDTMEVTFESHSWILDAVCFGNLEFLQSIHKRFPNIIQKTHSQTCPYLHLASLYDRVDIVEFLVEKLKLTTNDVKMYIQKQGILSIIKFGENRPLDYAIYNGSEATALKLLELGAETRVYEDISQLVFEAVRQNLTTVVDSLLKVHPDLINQRDSNDKILIHYAAEQASYAMIDVLLKHGADINAVDSLGKQTIHYAVTNFKYERVLIELLEMRPELINQVTPANETPLLILMQYVANYKLESYLIKGAQRKIELLIKHDCNNSINNVIDNEAHPYFGMSAIHIACSSEHLLFCLDDLIKAKADLLINDDISVLECLLNIKGNKLEVSEAITLLCQTNPEILKQQIGDDQDYPVHLYARIAPLEYLQSLVGVDEKQIYFKNGIGKSVLYNLSCYRLSENFEYLFNLFAKHPNAEFKKIVDSAVEERIISRQSGIVTSSFMRFLAKKYWGVYRDINHYLPGGYTPLLLTLKQKHYVCDISIILGKINKIEKCVSNSVSDDCGKHALHYCAENDKLEKDLLLQVFDKSVDKAPTWKGLSPLCLAVKSRNKKFIKTLLQVDPSLLDHSIKHDNENILSYALDIYHSCDSNNDTESIFRNELFTIIKLMVETNPKLLNVSCGTGLDDYPRSGKYPIHVAYEFDEQRLVKLFLKHMDRDVMIQNTRSPNYGMYVSHLFVLNGDWPNLKRLLKNIYNQDVTVQNSNSPYDGLSFFHLMLIKHENNPYVNNIYHEIKKHTDRQKVDVPVNQPGSVFHGKLPIQLYLYKHYMTTFHKYNNGYNKFIATYLYRHSALAVLHPQIYQDDKTRSYLQDTLQQLDWHLKGYKRANISLHIALHKLNHHLNDPELDINQRLQKVEDFSQIVNKHKYLGYQIKKLAAAVIIGAVVAIGCAAALAVAVTCLPLGITMGALVGTFAASTIGWQLGIAGTAAAAGGFSIFAGCKLIEFDPTQRKANEVIRASLSCLR